MYAILDCIKKHFLLTELSNTHFQILIIYVLKSENFSLLFCELQYNFLIKKMYSKIPYNSIITSFIYHPKTYSIAFETKPVDF